MSAERNETRSMAMALAGCGLAGLLAVGTAVALIRHQANPELHMGDIVAFNRAITGEPVTPLTVHKASGATCQMDPDILANGGGSLIVEGVADSGAPLYRVHWAGSATASGPQDCGHQAELLLSESDLDALSAVAGGFGVNQKTLAYTPPIPGMALAAN